MIYTERKVSIKNDMATIDSPIILFRGDREVEIMFTIVDSKFKFQSNKGNVIDKTQAAFGQLAVALPDGTDLFTEIVECENGVVIFSITGEMIDEIHEVGFYSFHIRLYNDDKTSRITLPPVMEGIEIREPLIIEGDVENTDLVGDATVGYSMVQTVGTDEEVFDEDGNYIPTVWGIGDKITAEKLNKIEDGISNATPDVSVNDVTIDLMDTVYTQGLFEHSLEDFNTASTQPYANKDLIIRDCNINEINIGIKYDSTGTASMIVAIIDPEFHSLFTETYNIEVTEEKILLGRELFKIQIPDIQTPKGSNIIVHTPYTNIVSLLYNSTFSGDVLIFNNEYTEVLTSVSGSLAIYYTHHENMQFMDYMDTKYIPRGNLTFNDIVTTINVTESTAAKEAEKDVTVGNVYTNYNGYGYDIIIKSIEMPMIILETGTADIDLFILLQDGRYTQYNLSAICDSIGTINISFDNLDIHVPAMSYIALKNNNSAITNIYQPDTGSIYTINLSEGNNSWTLGGVVSDSILLYTLQYTRNISVSDSIDTRMIGKKIIAIGDSMVQGHSISKDAGWLAMIANRNSMRYVNYGINGRYMSNKLYGEYPGVVDSFQDMDDDADYIIVFAGTNDATASVTIGNDDSIDPSEFKGALNLICDGLLTKYPTKHIMFITPYLRNTNYPQYIEAIETICAKYSIPVFNNAKNGGICWQNDAQVAALTLGDTLHLNLAGMEYASYKYEAFLKKI